MNLLALDHIVRSPHLAGHPHREACQQARRYRLVRALRADRRARRAVLRAARAAEVAGLAAPEVAPRTSLSASSPGQALAWRT